MEDRNPLRRLWVSTRWQPNAPYRERRSSTPLRRFQRIGWIGFIPLHIAGWSVDRWDMLSRQSLPGLDLCPMVDQDGTDCVELRVRLELQQIVGDHPPHAGGLVGLAGIGGNKVLEQRILRWRNVLVRDADEVVVHDLS